MRLTPSRLSWKRLALRSRLSKLTLTSLTRAGTKVPALSFLQNGCTASLFQRKARRVARKLIQSRGVPAKAGLLREDLALRSRLSKLTLTSLNRAGTKVPALSFLQNGCTASLFQRKARRVARKLIQSRGVPAKACLLREDLALRSKIAVTSAEVTVAPSVRAI